MLAGLPKAPSTFNPVVNPARAKNRQETDSLRSLEERIHQAVQLVNRLRQEKDAAQQKAEQLAAEVEALRAERKQVRGRIEKLLGQVDQLSGA